MVACGAIEYATPMFFALTAVTFAFRRLGMSFFGIAWIVCHVVFVPIDLGLITR